MVHFQSATPLTLPQDFASNACEPIKPDTNDAKLGDLSKFGSLGDSGVSRAATTCDWLSVLAYRQISRATTCDTLGILAGRQSSQATSSDASLLEERGGELQKGEIMSIVQGVVKNSGHAASVMDPTDPDERLLAVSESFQEITGFNESELLQASPRLLTTGCEHDVDPEVQAAIRSTHLTGSALLAQVVNRKKQGWLFWNTMYIRGLIVAADPVSEEPMWLVLTTYSSSEGPSAEEPEDCRDALRKLRGVGEDLRAEIHDGLARCAGGACRLAEPEADAPLGCRGGSAEDSLGLGSDWRLALQEPRWC